MSHAKLSPSHSSTWLHCPAALAAEADFPEETSEFAREGTIAHELAEKYLRTGNIAGTYIGASIDGEVITEEMDTHIQMYVDYVRDLPGRLLVERRVSMDHIVPECYGTADAIIVNDSLLTVIDLKYGKGVKVDSPNNSQLMLYGLGAVAEFDYLYDIERVKLVIVQPRLYHISEWTVDV